MGVTGKLFADLEFRLHLFDEADVFGFGAHHVLQRINLLGLRVADGVDGTTRTFSQTLQDFVVEESLSHELVLPPGPCCFVKTCSVA